tara:strand:+ start:679 stop:918 length:240 start_codon:yes stop_codon:yes gene_type:complete
MTIAQLAHQDSTELATALHGFNAWLDTQQPTPEEQDKILNHMHAEDQARLDASFIAAVDSGDWDGENPPHFTLADQLAH